MMVALSVLSLSMRLKRSLNCPFASVEQQTKCTAPFATLPALGAVSCTVTHGTVVVCRPADAVTCGWGYTSAKR
jgi:hypothetical protein